jgi:HK97 family phage major capsid protein
MLNKENVLLKSERERLLNEARSLTNDPQATKQMLKRADVLLAQVASLKSREEMQIRAADAAGISLTEVATEEQRELHRQSTDLRNYLVQGRESRTYSGLNIAVDSSGGFFVPQSFYTSVTAALKQADGLWNDDVVTLYEDTHGNALACALVDDTATSAVLVAEAGTSIENEIPVIDRLLLPKIPTWRSKKLALTMELAQDSAFPVESAIIVPAVAGRFQRGIGAANVATLIASTTSGSTSETASAISLNDAANLMLSINPVYLNQPKTFFACSFPTLVSMLKLKDSNGHYQWTPSRDANGRYLLFGIPVIVMPSLPNCQGAVTGTKGGLFLGDFSRCLRRIVKDSMTILRYSNSAGLAENGVFAYEAFVRCSFGVLASASSDSPIKFVTMA